MNEWSGPTYYDRPQLKPAPFNKYLVGGYVFLAGLSGGAQILGTLLDLARGRAARTEVQAARTLSMLGPSLGSLLLIYDLHTPKRFYNMFRVFKRRSPMSMGTWMLTAFSGFSGLSFLGNWIPLLRPVAKVAQVPAAMAGAGMGTYTAGLLSSTSSPAWAAAPRALSVRFGASSIAAAAALLSLFARREDVREDLEAVCAGALSVELAATAAMEAALKERGVDPVMRNSAPGIADRVGSVGVGVLAPLAIYGLRFLTGERSRELATAASLAVLAGSLTMRISTIGIGEASALQPEVSFRFAKK